MQNGAVSDFYNFIAGGGTGRYTYWTNAPVQTPGAYAYDAYSINIKGYAGDIFKGVGNGAIGLAEDSFGVFGMAAKWALGREDLFSRLSVKYKSAELIGVIGFALVEPSPGGEMSAAGKVFRGGNSFKLSAADIRSAFEKATGLTKGERGLSVNTNHLDKFVKDYGGAWEVDVKTIPKDFILKHTSGSHYEIVAPKGMTLDAYQKGLDQIQVMPYNTWPMK